MSVPNQPVKPVNKQLLWTYIIGFVFSVLLTLIAYFLVVRGALPTTFIVASVGALAVIQLFVQLVFFLHLGSEPKPRLNLTVFLFAALVVVIVGFGSLWIMNNLNYNQPSGMKMGNYIIQDEGIKQ